jgi:hypothetical protein
MSSSDNEDDTKPSAVKKLKQDGESEPATAGVDASAASAAATTVYCIIHGSFEFSELDNFSFLVPAGADADRVLAALLQSTKQYHTWSIVADEEIEAKLLQKIPKCLAPPIGTLPESFPENQTEEALLDLVLTGGAGLMTKTYVVLHIKDGKRPEYDKFFIPILVESEQQRQQVQQAAERLAELFYRYADESRYISDWDDVWNQSEYKLRLVDGQVSQANFAFADEWVTSLVRLGAPERDENWDYQQVDDLFQEAKRWCDND